MNAIFPQHRSMLGRSKTPRNMSRIPLPDDQREFADQFALDIFTDAVNAGQTFQASLSAIFLSGLKIGDELARRGLDDPAAT